MCLTGLLVTHPPWPVPDWELEWVLRELDGDLGECELPVEGEPRVVEAEAHERQQEVQLLVHLGMGVPAVASGRVTVLIDD